MKKILLFLFLFPTVVFAQRYNSPNVHFYLPDGYSIKDLEKRKTLTIHSPRFTFM